MTIICKNNNRYVYVNIHNCYCNLNTPIRQNIHNYLYTLNSGQNHILVNLHLLLIYQSIGTTICSSEIGHCKSFCILKFNLFQKTTNLVDRYSNHQLLIE